MKNSFILKSFVFLCALVIGSGSALATEEVYKTLTFCTAGINTNKYGNYTSSWTETVSSFGWTISNFNNNNWGWTDGGSPALYIVKCGRKYTGKANNPTYTPSIATIVTNTAIDQAITKVVVTLTAINSSDYNSIKLYMASTSAFDEDNDDYFETITVNSIPSSAGNMTITVPEAKRAANRYYKIVFDTKGTTNSNGHTGVSKVEYYYNATGGSTPSISADDVNLAYNATSGSIAYTLANATGNVTAEVTSGDWLTLGTITSSTVPFTCSANEGYLPRIATVTLSFTGASNKVVTVTQASNYGTSTNPYTVAQAIAVIDAAGKTTVNDKYVTGTVSQVDNINSNAITYWISDDGTTEDQFEVFKGKGISGADFSSTDDIQVGDMVVVYGNITYYSTGSVYEFSSGSNLVSQKLVAPTFYPAEGAVGSGTELTIDDAHTDATIYYTTDGNTPTTSSTQYNSNSKPTITASTTFKAIAVKSGCENSDVSSASYTILAPVATPEITLAGGTYTSAQSTTITCATEGATIYYTTNGNNPTTSSTEYTGAISINESMTIKAIAAKDGMANSAVAEAAYTINIPAINAANVNIAYNATFGTIASTIANEVEGGALTAVITGGNEGTWLSLGTVDGTNVPLTCSANEGNADRTATVTLTYTYETDKTVTKDVVVTQAKYVKDFADLPFSWTGSDSAPTGITNNGVGTYAAAPYLKFDGTGDYIILKINEAPGVLSFDIKGNGFSGGTFKVQTSADGSSYSDLKSYTSLGDTQSEEFTDLASTVRYIKWVYTTKSSGNVALGNISLAKDLPYINLNSYSISVSDAEAEGTLTASYKGVVKESSSDVEIRWFESNGSTPASEPSWATVEVNGEYNIAYHIEENNESARTAYFKVYGLNAEADDVYSSLVTISQAAVSVANLPFSFDKGKSDIESENGLTASGLGSDYASSPKLRFDDTDDYLLLHLSEAPGTLSYDIKNNSFSGGTFTVQISADGKTYADLKAYKSITSTQSESFSLPSNVRYIKWVYTTKSSGNVALGNISVTAFDPEAATITLGATLNNGRYWATFYNTSRYTLPAGAQAFTMNASNQLYRLGADGSVIPANTAVIIIADSPSITLAKSNDETVISVNGNNNILVGAATDVAVDGIDGTPYVMGIKSGTLGFYQFTGTSIPAFKAYYIVK